MDPQQYQEEQVSNNLPYPNTKPKLWIFGVIAGGIILVLLIISILLGISSSKAPSPLPTPTPLSTPTTQPTPRLTAIPTEILQKALDQAAADKKYGDYVNKVNDSYPWYNSLPLQTKDYFVYFNVENKVFIAKIYTNGNSSIVPFTKSLITKQLTDLGVDLSKYSIDWSIQ